MLNLVDEVLRKILEVPDVISLRILVDHGDQLGIGASLVSHEEHPDNPGRDQAARECRVIEQDECIEWVAVLGQGIFHESVITRIAGSSEQATVESEHVALVVELVLVPTPCRDLDDDVDECVGFCVRRAHDGVFLLCGRSTLHGTGVD